MVAPWGQPCSRFCTSRVFIPSFSRPSVSNENPYSESLFRTMKYRSEYSSQPFSTIEAAQAWVDCFVLWYNTEPLHRSIRFVTSDDRYYGRKERETDHRYSWLCSITKKTLKAQISTSTKQCKKSVFRWQLL